MASVATTQLIGLPWPSFMSGLHLNPALKASQVIRGNGYLQRLGLGLQK